MGNVVTDAGNLMDESFDLAQHAVDAGGELVEWVVAPVRRQALAQIAGHDPSDSPVDLRESTASPQAQYQSDHDCQTESRQQAQQKGTPDDVGNAGDLFDVAANRKNFPTRQSRRRQPHFLRLTSLIVEANHHGASRDMRRQATGQALEVARDAMTVGTEQARDPDAAWIVVQTLVDVRKPPLRRLGRKDVQLPGDQGIE